jgi:hypothetical protein
VPNSNSRADYLVLEYLTRGHTIFFFFKIVWDLSKSQNLVLKYSGYTYEVPMHMRARIDIRKDI